MQNFVDVLAETAVSYRVSNITTCLSEETICQEQLSACIQLFRQNATASSDAERNAVVSSQPATQQKRPATTTNTASTPEHTTSPSTKRIKTDTSKPIVTLSAKLEKTQPLLKRRKPNPEESPNVTLPAPPCEPQPPPEDTEETVSQSDTANADVSQRRTLAKISTGKRARTADDTQTEDSVSCQTNIQRELHADAAAKRAYDEAHRGIHDPARVQELQQASSSTTLRDLTMFGVRAAPSPSTTSRA